MGQVEEKIKESSSSSHRINNEGGYLRNKQKTLPTIPNTLLYAATIGATTPTTPISTNVVPVSPRTKTKCSNTTRTTHPQTIPINPPAGVETKKTIKEVATTESEEEEVERIKC
jgi:hypothetical protein